MSYALLITIGLLAGALGGFVGVGGGVIIVPALVLLLGYSQKTAQGTTLAMLCMPVAIFAALTYYRAGYVQIKPALWIALGFAVGSLVSSHFAVKLHEHSVARIFGILLLAVGAKLVFFGR